MHWSNWKWPDIEGLHDFKGTLLHTAKWDESVKLEGKSVAVIGSGASGIQIVPEIQPRMCFTFPILTELYSDCEFSGTQVNII